MTVYYNSGITNPDVISTNGKNLFHNYKRDFSFINSFEMTFQSDAIPSFVRLLILLFFISTVTVFSQTQVDSLEFISVEKPFNLLSTKLEKQLNTYSLHSIFLFDKAFNKVKLKLSEGYNSSFVNSAEKSIRDEQSFSLSSAYKITSLFNLGLLVHNNILSDSRKIEINSASVTNTALFSEINPMDKLTITPFAGYMNNRQIGQNDYGALYGGEAILNNLNTPDFNLYSEFKFRNEDISPRKNALRFFDVQFTNNFTPQVKNQVQLDYVLNKKDFYFQADSLTAASFDISNNIQSRTEANYIIQDKFQHANFLNAFVLDITGRMSYRNIDRDTRYRLPLNTKSIFDTRINELNLELESSAGYSSSFFDGLIKVIFSGRDEQHLTKRFAGVSDILYEERQRDENSKNNNAARASLSFLGNLNLSQTDKLYFSFFQNKLKYDTPSNINFDDRDEVLSILKIKYSKLLTPFFETFLSLEGTINHTVYIFAEKSSNNNFNRIIRLSSGGNYVGKNISSYNTFEVSANYTVYDFEELNPNFHSYSFRQFSANDSSNIKITKGLIFRVFSYVKLSEQGDLQWKAFSTHPNRFLSEVYSEPKLAVQIKEILFSTGIRYFAINTFNFNGQQKIPESKYLSIGPVAEINLLIRSRLSLNFYGWYEFITDSGNMNRKMANFNFEMNWKF